MKHLVIALGLLISSLGYAQQLTLSDKAEISLVTLGPDQDELVQAFGHSAVRVADPVLRIDFVFNYGVFSFDQPNFYLNFARGHNNYYLGMASYPDFRDAYIYYNRYVHEQVLNLHQGQKQALLNYLMTNAQPKNRNYLYDYFYNNCSTKIRDVLLEVLKDSIQFDGSYITTDYTIRQLTDPYLKGIPWGDLGIDIGLGSPIDHKAVPFEYMYLPEYLESAVDHAYINRDGKRLPLVKEKIIVYANTPAEPIRSLVHPWLAFGALLVLSIALLLFDLKRKKLSTWFDIVLFGVVGFVGLILLLLWTATDHKASANNLNILWALPTHLVVIFFLFKKNKPAWLPKYFIVTAVICGLLLLFWPLLPQLLNIFLIPVVATLGVRAFANFRLLRPAA